MTEITPEIDNTKRVDALSKTPRKTMPYESKWTRLTVRKSSIAYLRDLADIHPEMWGGVPEPRSMNSMFEELLAAAPLVHHDMGASFVHTDLYCPCGPSWPK